MPRSRRERRARRERLGAWVAVAASIPLVVVWAITYVFVAADIAGTDGREVETVFWTLFYLGPPMLVLAVMVSVLTGWRRINTFLLVTPAVLIAALSTLGQLLRWLGADEQRWVLVTMSSLVTVTAFVAVVSIGLVRLATSRPRFLHRW